MSGHLSPDASGRSFAALESLYTRLGFVVLRPVDLLDQRPITAVVEPLNGASGHCVTSVRSSVQSPL